jgi:hypothetical protein
MRAFEVHLNGKRLCLAGVGEDGVLTAIVDHVARPKASSLNLRVGGLVSPIGKHVIWRNRRLKVGDEVLVKIVETDSADRPRKRYSFNPEGDAKKQKAHVRAMAKKFGWRIDTRRAG